MKVAIIGSGISGLAAAHTLMRQGGGTCAVTLLEAGDYFGGHTHTVDVTLPSPAGAVTHGVDTGFLVFNEQTYPRLIALFEELGIPTAKSDMSFSVQVKPGGPKGGRALEWSGSSLNTVFAQRRNLLNWPFIGMLRDLMRFNALCSALAASGDEAQLRQPLGVFLKDHHFSQSFRDWYLLPMIACIWSCPTEQMLQFPVDALIRFCHNHGLLQVSNRPQWWTVAGGARQYVEAITARIADKRLNARVTAVERGAPSQAGSHQGSGSMRLTVNGVTEHFDKVIIATHADQALAMLQNPKPFETRTLGAFRYQPNRAVLHTDASVLPSRKSAWAAWNHEHTTHSLPRPSGDPAAGAVCLHYLINRLQPLPWQQPVIVSLNPSRDIAARHVLGEYAYSHPVFDQGALIAQRRMPWLQGQQNTWYCGAWMGYGFHEDGLKAGEAAARHLLGLETAPEGEAP